MEISVDVDPSGALLSGVARRVLDEALSYALTQAGQEASKRIHRILDERIVHPTPYYETQITTDVAPGHVRIHDRGVSYGPWLEGISPENTRSRFKGYKAFGSTLDYLVESSRAQVIVQQALDRYLARIGGH
jgi:hypothetical protein